MKLVTKVLGGVVVLAGVVVGAICLAKKHNDNEIEYVDVEVKTDEDSDLDEEEAE